MFTSDQAPSTQGRPAGACADPSPGAIISARSMLDIAHGHCDTHCEAESWELTAGAWSISHSGTAAGARLCRGWRNKSQTSQTMKTALRNCYSECFLSLYAAVHFGCSAAARLDGHHHHSVFVRAQININIYYLIFTLAASQARISCNWIERSSRDQCGSDALCLLASPSQVPSPSQNPP